MVDQNADKYAERTALSIGDLLNAGIIKPLELINPLNLLASCSPNKNTETEINESDTSDHLSEHNTVIINPSDKQIDEHWDDVLNGKAYYQGVNINDRNIPTRLVFRHPNESRTAEKSQELENMMYTALDEYRNRVNYRTLPFDIPYGDREITIKPEGDLFKRNISVNALDSLAKYAGITKTPIQDALGLAWQETKFGRMPLFNDSSIGGGYTARDLENSNYFSNFGTIPAEYLVRDFRYNGDLVFDGKRDTPISLSTPPLQHALEYFNSGRYNTNDKNHTSDVKSSGRKIWNETTGSLIDWWNKEGIKWYKASKE